MTVVLAPSPARAQFLIPPVDAAIAQGFDEPESDYSAGHRGIDYSVPVGSRVRAAGEGMVTFAGSVAGSLAVTIDHGGGLETTYSRLAEVWVEAGRKVDAGTWIGLSGNAHPGEPGLHLGAKLDGRYVDPADLLGPIDASGALRLTPLLWEPSASFGDEFGSALAPTGPGDHHNSCAEVQGEVAKSGAPPNDNVVVAVAGIASKTRGGVSADMYRPGPRFFGYHPEHTYEFSYRGSGGPGLHTRYERTDTYGDIRAAARELAVLVDQVGQRHPGKDVDLIAHSQGGIVARTYLAEIAHAHAGPRIEHFITFATPHDGAPAAGNVDHLARDTVTGPMILAGASKLARAGHRVPDPLAPAVRQLAPGSQLMDSLASKDLLYGTRVLTLAIPNDLIVPADRTDLYGSTHRVVPPRDVVRRLGPALVPGNGHSGIVTSETARAYVRGFLSGRPAPCPTVWDEVGPKTGAAVSWVEGNLGGLVSLAEGFGGRIVASVADLLD